MRTWWKDSWRLAVHALYPRTCVCCHSLIHPIYNSEFCLACLAELTPMDLGHFHPNPALDHFYGRCAIRHAHAHFNFRPGGKAQTLVHKIKYEGRQDLMSVMGSRMGHALSSMAWANDLDAVLCVPIHWKRWYMRGYNQGGVLGNAIARELGIPFIHGALKRYRDTPSQTGLSRIERVENLKGCIRCKKDLGGMRHVLLVDDVLTTGATIEACTLALQEQHPVDISLACLAIGGM